MASVDSISSQSTLELPPAATIGICTQQLGASCPIMTRLLTDGSEQHDSSQAIVSHQCALVPVEERLQKLRVDREVHSYKQIWTKDPHGGPYRKAGGKVCDPLLHEPDGTLKQVELGYERVEHGPTTNFVGNHMTQGAIDLVQAELERPSAETLLLLEEQEGKSPAGPQLLENAEVGSKEPAPPAVPLAQYSWWDGGEVVCVRLDLGPCRQQLQQLAAGALGPAAAGSSQAPIQITCSFKQHSLQLTLSHRQPLAGDGGGSRATDEAAAPSSNTVGSPLPPPTVQLVVERLCQAIQPELCTVAAVVEALPAAQGVPVAAPPADSGPLDVADQGPAQAVQQGAPGSGSSGSAAPVASGCEGRTVRLKVQPGVGAVLVRLQKADPAAEWGSLAAAWEVSTAQQQGRQQQPDLAALRRLVRQQRQLGRTALASGSTPGLLQGTPASASDQLEASGSASAATAGTAGLVADMAPSPSRAGGQGLVQPPSGNWPSTSDWDGLLAGAHSSMQSGQYEAAVEACTALLQRWGAHLGVAAAGIGLAAGAEVHESAGVPPTSAARAAERAGLVGGLAEVLSLRAACHCHMGCLKQAAADYTAALELCASPEQQRQQPECSTAAPTHAISTQPTTTHLLLARAGVYEQLEQYSRALEDLRQLAALQQPVADPQVALSIQRVSRSLREAERVQQQEEKGRAGSTQPPSVPRTSALFGRQPRGLRV